MEANVASPELNIPEVAGQVASFLAPWLPFLIKGGKEAGKAAAKKLGEKFSEDGWEKAKSLWDKLHPKVESKPSALEAVKDVADHPDDPDVQAALRVQFKKLLESEPALTIEISNQIQHIGHSFLATDRSVSGYNINAPIFTGDISLLLPRQYERVPLERVPSEELVRAYFRSLANECSQLPLGIVAKRFLDPESMGAVQLPSIYVDLDVQPSFIEQEKKRQREFVERERADRVPLLQAIAHPQLSRVVLLGEAGSGKTSAVHYLTYALDIMRNKGMLCACSPMPS